MVSRQRWRVFYKIGDKMANSWDYAAKFKELAKLAGLEAGENGIIETGVTFSTDELNEFIGKIIDKYTLVVRPEMTASSTSIYEGGSSRPPHAPPAPDVA